MLSGLERQLDQRHQHRDATDKLSEVGELGAAHGYIRCPAPFARSVGAAPCSAGRTHLLQRFLDSDRPWCLGFSGDRNTI